MQQNSFSYSVSLRIAFSFNVHAHPFCPSTCSSIPIIMENWIRTARQNANAFWNCIFTCFKPMQINTKSYRFTIHFAHLFACYLPPFCPSTLLFCFNFLKCTKGLCRYELCEYELICQWRSLHKSSNKRIYHVSMFNAIK